MKYLIAIAALATALPFAVPAGAQTPPAPTPAAQAPAPMPQVVPQTTAADIALIFQQAAYVTCREAHAMPVDQRRQLAIFLAEHAARVRGVMIPDDERGGQIALLIRGGCTLSPDAHLFAVVDKAIVAESSKLPKRQ